MAMAAASPRQQRLWLPPPWPVPSAPPSVACPVAEHHYRPQQRRWPRIQQWIYCSNTCAIKPLPGRRCLFRYVHRLIQFPISEHQLDRRERQALPGLWTGPLNFVMHYR